MSDAAVAVEGAGAPGPDFPDGALLLARWTRLSEETAQTLYIELRRSRPGLVELQTALRGAADLGGIADVRVRNILALCHAADNAGELPRYCSMIAAQERARGRPADEIKEIIGRVGHPGEPQGVVNRARGVADPSLFGTLDLITRAIGYVELDNGGRRNVIGTALLVRRDLVITCAHVAFDPRRIGSEIVTGPPPHDIHRICFPRTQGAQEARLHRNQPLLEYSNAHMIGIQKLDRFVDAAAMRRLDFALLRLDRAIQGVEPIDIRHPIPATFSGLSFVIGFPGSANPCFDADTIIRDERVGGRLIHMMNTVEGMSGGCVINQNGVPIGLHEGSIPLLDEAGQPQTDKNGVSLIENRAILLGAISSHLDRLPTNPLRSVERSLGIVIHDEALVTRLGRRGAQLLNSPEAQPGWDALVRKITAAKDGVPWTAHPWFAGDGTRKELERWFMAAADPAGTKSRVAFVGGDRGCGKTFTIDVLKRLVEEPDADVIRVAWTEGDSTLATLARCAAETLPPATGTRTADGHVRYEDVPNLVAALSRYGGVDRVTGRPDRPLFVAIDAGDGTGSVTEPESWIDAVVALSRQPWARLLLCGLPAALKDRVENTLPGDVEARSFELPHVRMRDIADFLEKFGMAAEAGQTPAMAAAAFGASRLPVEKRQLTTTFAALFAIGWHRGLLPEHADAPGDGR
ncbi:hypothetical protein J2847_002133 [Azospirillum agricola]|uniref:trypsin-like serine peptidase n=1 Tax=Azospirillum agricola TaxID=1720247 RepID=UPI001AE6023E|nr:serine protease [Azospirillum agricola]MBP2228841.1 hypothetical protein [Azospirillum agricola]